MKRLISMFASALAVLFVSQGALAQQDTSVHNKKKVSSNGQNNAVVPKEYPAGPERNKEYPASPIAYLQPFMPKDTKVGVGWIVGRKCDQNGNFVESGTAMCKIWISHSAGKTYIFRQSEQEGDRVFVRSGDKAELYVHFNGGRYANTIAYQSPAAQQFAAASGSQTVPVVASNGTAPAQQRTVNCKDSNINLGDRIACASGKANNVGSAGTPAPAAPPQAAPAPTQDCSKLGVVARIKCEAMAVAGK